MRPLQDNLSVVSNFGYFSFVTLTSVGYGDVVPVHPCARSLANVEAIIGQRDCGPPTVTNEFNINANSSAATGCWRCVG
jgi:hypothetical protein